MSIWNVNRLFKEISCGARLNIVALFIFIELIHHYLVQFKGIWFSDACCLLCRSAQPGFSLFLLFFICFLRYSRRIWRFQWGFVGESLTIVLITNFWGCHNIFLIFNIDLRVNQIKELIWRRYIQIKWSSVVMFWLFIH